MTKITQTQTKLIKKPGTKTVWIEEYTKQSEVSEEFYRNYVNAASFFRRLGGSVTQSKDHTSCGYLVVMDVTTNPQRSERTVTEWTFDYVGGERC